MAVEAASDSSRPESVAAKLGRLDNSTVFFFSVTGLPGAALGLMLGTYMPKYFTGHLHMDLVVWAATLAFVRLIDIPFDPAIAMVMDRVSTPWGRYKVWMVLGLPLLMGGTYLMFNAPVGVTTQYLITALLVLYAGTSIFNLAHAAWAANLATGYNERSRVYGWMQAVAVLGSVGLSAAPILTHGLVNPAATHSVPMIGTGILIAFPVTMAIVFFLAPERVLKAQASKGGNVFAKAGKFFGDAGKALGNPSMLRIIVADLCLVLGPGTTSPIYAFFFRDAKGFTPTDVSLLLIPYIGAGLFGAPFWAMIARWLGKHRTLQVGVVCYAIAQTTLMALPKALFVPTAIGMFCVGFCAACFVIMIRAMVADIADEVKLDQGKEQISLLYSMIGITGKIGGSLTSIIIFPILAWVGFQAADEAKNTPDAIFGLEMCYLFAPIIFTLIGGTLMFGYKLDAKKHGEIREALDARAAAEDAQAGLPANQGTREPI